MHLGDFSFGRIRINGVLYYYDVVIDRGEVRKHKKKPSKKFRGEFGHTPLSLEEKIPWACRRLLIGIGCAGGLPVMEAVKLEAKRRGVELTISSDRGSHRPTPAGRRGDQRDSARHLLRCGDAARR